MNKGLLWLIKMFISQYTNYQYVYDNKLNVYYDLNELAQTNDAGVMLFNSALC